MKLLLTSIYHKLDKNKYTFFVLDPVTKLITNSVPFQAELDVRPSNRPTPASEDLEFLPFGITSGDGKIFVSSNYNIAEYDANTLAFNKIVSDSGVPHVHEIKYDNGYIFRANTTNDTVSRINLTTGEEIHFSFKKMSQIETMEYPVNQKMDVFHINSLTPHGDNLYVLAHNRYQKRAEVFVMDKDLTSATKLANLDYACHDIVIHDGKLYSFGSQRGMLITMDLATNRVTKKYIVNSDDFFLRGGVILNGKLVVFANGKGSVTFVPFEEPENRPNAFVLTIDLETGEIEKTETNEFSSIGDMEVLN